MLTTVLLSSWKLNLLEEMENVFYNSESETFVSHRHLPHWEQQGKLYFVTFRLADSIPAEKIQKLKQEQVLFLENNSTPYSEIQEKTYYYLFYGKVEGWLDNCYGACLLNEQKYSMIVKDALDYFDGKRYWLDHWVIMPNHVHVILMVKSTYKLNDILHSWKSFTANAINKQSQHVGQLWQHESFDHIIRSEYFLEKYREYIIDNKQQMGIDHLLLSTQKISI